MLRKLLHEPLLHFLLLGGLLFAVYYATRPAPDMQIAVSAADVERLAQEFATTWRRPPSDDELEAMIEDYIRDQVLARVGVSLGLDQDDTIIQRRLRQKMEFLLENNIAEPREEELRSFYLAHADKFQSDELISFQQVFVSSRRGEQAESDARQILARLVGSTTAQETGARDEGDASLLSDHFSRAPLEQVRAQFGDDFARVLKDIEPGGWVGPLKSPYGFHVVQVTAVENGGLRPFAEVHEAVRREWLAERRAAALAEQYQKLRDRYQVIVDYPSGSAAQR
jgi:hypothetical protein